MRESEWSGYVYVDNFRLVWSGKAPLRSKLCPHDRNEKVKIWVKSTADLTVIPHLKLRSSSIS